ncbi:hypothetical protein [Labrenzia sp. R5_0]|uniref:hypothetical protein n=1 Tax=Labrenzia sp. R5_0 TaxID=2821108 RepID=UPI001ADC2277|nr:hypothetical protein [Labrenzia sp. R5_0]MBO9459839.1 hypothetical protein [Labrenzia sp. R5_0]
MTSQISDIVVPRVFTPYMAENKPAKLIMLEKSGILAGPAPEIGKRFKAGGNQIEVPYWEDLDDAEPTVIDDSDNKIGVSKITASDMKAYKHRLAKKYGAKTVASYAATGRGDSAMNRVAERISAYWGRRKEERIIATAEGVIADNVANDSGDMVYSIYSDVGSPTAATAPSGVVSASNGSASAWQVFSRSEGKTVLSSGATGWVQYQFPGSVVIDAYMLQAPNDNSQNDDMPWQWNIEASNNGSDWTILDTQDGQDTWASNEWREYDFHNETAFTHYRLSFTQGGGSASDNSAIGQLVFHQAGNDQSPFTLTASGTGGINGGAGFQASDVGRHIRFRGSDGFWRWFRIHSRQSATSVKVQLFGQALQDTKAQSIWRLGAWSGTTGWPETIGWHKNRLAFAGTSEEPQKIWESQTEDFTNFSVSHVLKASDAVTAGILSGQVNRIQWLVDDNDLIVGTTRAVRAVGKATDQDPYGPENVDQKPETNFGANDVSPIKVGSVLIYYGPYGTDMREMAYDFGSDGRVSQAVSEVQSHLFQDGISGACYQQYPDSVIWQWDQKGRGIGFTYERQQQVYGMQRHDFGGVVECMADLSGAGADTVWMIVKRTIDGQVRRYIEIMQRPFPGGMIEDAWHLDCGARYEGQPATTVSGLQHLEGEEVILYADGTDYPATVTAGEASLPNGQTAEKILVGLNVSARAKTLPFPVNAQDGSAMGRKMRVDNCSIAVLNTGTLKAGSDETFLDELIYYRAGDPAGEPAPLRTGVLDQPIETRWEDGGQLTLAASGGKPCTILAVNFGRDVEP